MVGRSDLGTLPATKLASKPGLDSRPEDAVAIGLDSTDPLPLGTLLLGDYNLAGRTFRSPSPD